MNPQGAKDVTPSQSPLHRYILKCIAELTPDVTCAMEWYIKSMMVEYLSPSYKELLGQIPSSKWINVEKSTQQLACAMHINC